jgi:peptidoglycan pentaglycine glycine transferase (the first glycine)
MDRTTWNTLISDLPNPHILQTWEWGKVKSAFGWQPLYRQWNTGSRGASLVLQRKVSLGKLAAPICVLYAPKGPLLDWNDSYLRDQVLDDLQKLAQGQGVIFIKIDPDVPLEPAPDDRNAMEDQIAGELKQRGWFFSRDQIQFKNTVVIDLSVSEEDLLGRMKPKTRYNIRLAERKGVRVRIGSPDDYPLLYRMYAETSLRDGFAIREEAYYRAVWQTFAEAGMAEALIAETDENPIAGLFLFYFGGKAWYLYGMSRAMHRDKMPNYLLQWEAMRRARGKGCKLYDLWGAPDHFDEHDPMWGVYRFKAGLGGQVVRTLGAWDFTSQPLLYRLYTQTLPHILSIMRRLGTSRIQQRLRGTMGNP